MNRHPRIRIRHSANTLVCCLLVSVLALTGLAAPAAAIESFTVAVYRRRPEN